MRSRGSMALGRLVVAVALSLVVSAGCDDSGRATQRVAVMTHNLYLGLDVNPLLEASSPDDIPVLAAQACQQLILTNFAERAEAIADEIGRRQPVLIGLQEVALFRIQSPGDAVVGGAIPAETVLEDHLEILMAALAARGLQYVVAGKVQNTDVELPMLTNVDPPAFDDIRMTDFDVILARSDVPVSGSTAVTYQAKAFVPSLGLDLLRGYVAVDAEAPGVGPVTFVTTHLEDAPFLDVQAAQVRELAAALAGRSRRVILLGDFNSPAPSGDVSTFLASQGFRDVWTGPGDGLTWGHDPDLRNGADQFTQRLDLIFVRENVRQGQSDWDVELWGDEPGERTVSGLWPSDHAAVVATFRPAARRRF